jgi:hypothetical protein
MVAQFPADAGVFSKKDQADILMHWAYYVMGTTEYFSEAKRPGREVDSFV